MACSLLTLLKRKLVPPQSNRFMRSIAAASLFLLSAVAAEARELPRYAVILSDPAPIGARASGGNSALEAARARVMSAQEVVRGNLRAQGIRITGSSHTFLNAIFVSAEPAQAAQLQSIAGVSHVAPLHRFHLNLDKAEQLIGIPAAWSLLNGTANAGAGVRIGVIDTGIQATHPAFQDSSLQTPSGFPICQVTYSASTNTPPLDCTASNTAKGFPLCASVNCPFTNAKVIVARSYVPLLSSGNANTSRPDDPSPRDRIGHGTAVAMAAAGITVTGPSDTITGVAPKAFLGNYKVFGSPGINDYTTGDVVIQALEDAFSDGMDIVVMSLGAPALSGPLDSGAACGLTGSQVCDAEAYVVQQAVNAGMVVVAAAGNGGQTGLLNQAALSTVDSPGDAPGAIAVAATTNSHTWGNLLTVSGSGTYRSRFGDGPLPSTTVGGPMGDVAGVGDPLACAAPPPGSLAGLFALVQRGTCTFVTKVQNLQAAGAIGAIITNGAGDDTLITPSGLNGTAIPAVFIGYDDGAAIRTYLANNVKAAVSISPTFSPFNIATFNQVAPFSSHGPSLGNAGLKPDVAAVGVDLYLAGQSYDPNGELFSASGFLVSQGTSFSAPQVAGIAALVKQSNPTLTANQIRSSVIDTATQDVTENGSAASILAVGAGKVSGASAVANMLTVSPVNAPFGVLNSATLPMTQQLQLTNTGATALKLSLSIVRRTPESTARTSLDLPNVTLAAGQTSNVNLTISGAIPAPGIYEGFVNIQGASNPLNVPYLYVVGDGIPNNLLSLAGNGDDGTAGQQTAGGYVILQAIDQYGVPVANLPVTFATTSGGGRLAPIANTTDNYGIAAAQAFLGSVAGTNVYTATAGGLSVTFQATGQLQPTITPGGVVTAGTFSQQPPAPGSYISIFGSFLANGIAVYGTPYLPVSLAQVSVSFDNPNVSVPGHIVFVSPGQVNVQIPWELQGQPSVQVKVTVGDNSGTVYTMPLGSYSPELFQIPSAGQNLAAALDENNRIVTAANPVARGHVVQLFANGLGPVTNQPASGDPAPSSPLAETTAVPVVMIGGVAAQVMFHGMTPGNAALYQVNAIVPAISAGVQPITISIAGVTSSTSLLPVN
jgi:minor extracellular serine protease Vpr